MPIIYNKLVFADNLSTWLITIKLFYFSDTEVYNCLSSKPSPSFPHALRWHTHISSLGAQLCLSISGPQKEGQRADQVKEEDKEDQAKEEDSDIDLFGSDDEEEDAQAAKIREERLKCYAEKKSKRPGPVAKSSVMLDVKPWDDGTDMGEVEASVRGIEMEGLTWGASQLVPLAFKIKKLSILCIVEDEKVSIDDLVDKICENEDIIQSVDIAAFNKI